MKLWIGQFKDEPSRWFVVWATTKEEAIEEVDGVRAAPDPHTMREIHDAGCFEFQAIKKEPDDVIIKPIEGNLSIILEGDTNEYIYRTVTATPSQKIFCHDAATKPLEV